nr:hypothetical protein [Tanacetum cinerariifolium]
MTLTSGNIPTHDCEASGLGSWYTSVLDLVVLDECSVSLLLTPLYHDGTHEVTPRVSALAGCDRHGERSELDVVNLEETMNFFVDSALCRDHCMYI